MPVMYISNDYGGYPSAYHRQAMELKRAHMDVVISGVCASACIAYLGLPNACVVPDAQLMAHHAQSDDAAIRANSETVVFSTVPARLAAYWRACINRQEECWITGAQAIAMGARRCK
jgi:hypothetical protein